MMLGDVKVGIGDTERGKLGEFALPYSSKCLPLRDDMRLDAGGHLAWRSGGGLNGALIREDVRH